MFLQYYTDIHNKLVNLNSSKLTYDVGPYL